MKKNILISRSPEETEKIGEKIAKGLRGGELIFLSGILGAGKTVLVRGITKSLGIKSKIPSPTFNIFRLYECTFPKSLKKGKFYHFDCYRLKKYSDLKKLGWEEIIGDEDSVVVLEWPECIVDRDITKLKNKNTISVDIKIGKSNERAFDIQYKK